MDIGQIFDEVSKKIRADLEETRKAIDTHPGIKGASFEETFRQFLRKYLPKSLDISTGLIVDSNGNQSKQIDVIISDFAKTPIFYEMGQNRVIPVECVYAVIEVKAHLDSNEVEKIFDNMKSVRSLEKKAYLKQEGIIVKTQMLYGKEWDIWPINYFVFAFDSIKLDDLKECINKRYEKDKLPEWSRIDTVCVLDKGVICNKRSDGKLSALPDPASIMTVYETKQSLLLFYTLVSVFLNQTGLPYFNFTDYMGRIDYS